MFSKEEHNALLTELRNAQSDADRLTIISKLETDYTDTITQHEQAISERDTAVSERDKYHELNNDMWLQISDQRKAGEKTIDDINFLGNNTSNNEPPKKMTFADLEAKMMEEYRRD